MKYDITVYSSEGYQYYVKQQGYVGLIKKKRELLVVGQEK